jgi:hypothetical protein
MPIYKGTFNWQGEVIELVTRRVAMNEGVAYRQLTRALAKRLGQSITVVHNYFSGSKDNYRIEPFVK